MSLSNWLFVAGVAQILLALGFEFVNGFHDAANAVTTVIYSKTLKPKTAIWFSAFCNFVGALFGGMAVAMLILKVVPIAAVSPALLVAVLVAGLIWNLGTWYFGIPASSSHCLIGSLIGAGIAAVGVDLVLKSPEILKAFKGLFFSPFAGALVAILLATVGAWLARPAVPLLDRVCTGGYHVVRVTVLPVLDFARGLAFRATHRIPYVKALTAAWNPENREARTIPTNLTSKVVQVAACGALSASHGMNDGQKMMGVITLILATQFEGFSTQFVPFWVMALAAATIGLGTRFGGDRIIKTVGEKLSNRPIDMKTGNAAQITTATIIFVATHFGFPVSTTHVSNSAVVGAQMGAYGLSAANPGIIGKIVTAWVVTIPICGVMAFGFYHLFGWLFPIVATFFA